MPSPFPVLSGFRRQPFPPDRFAALLERVERHMQERDRYVLDLYAGADLHYRLPITIVAEYAWHALFVKQLFVRPQAEELPAHIAEFTVIAAPEFEAVSERDGTTSSTFIITDFTRKRRAAARYDPPRCHVKRAPV